MDFFRDICAEHFLQNPVRIGGVGVEVQIDESLFVRRKPNVGRRPVPQQWVFSGIDTNTKERFLVAVPQRKAATLPPIVQQFIRPGTTVVSDLWAPYNTFGNIGYQHLTVNHQIKLVNPVTGAHTNTVENMWMRAKRRNKWECGTARGMIDTNIRRRSLRKHYQGYPTSLSIIIRHTNWTTMIYNRKKKNITRLTCSQVVLEVGFEEGSSQGSR